MEKSKGEDLVSDLKQANEQIEHLKLSMVPQENVKELEGSIF